VGAWTSTIFAVTDLRQKRLVQLGNRFYVVAL